MVYWIRRQVGLTGKLNTSDQGLEAHQNAFMTEADKEENKQIETEQDQEGDNDMMSLIVQSSE